MSDNTPTYSANDLINAYHSYDASEEAKEIILYFISDMTGKSPDNILEAKA